MNENFSFAIAYDFDGTLSPGNMQEYSFIPALGFQDPGDFWALTKQCPENTDQTLGYLFTMLKEARKRGIRVTREYLKSCGRDIKLFPGVDSWFDRISAYGRTKNITVSHYIISTGTREIIEGSPIAGYFKKYSPPASFTMRPEMPSGPAPPLTTPPKPSTFFGSTRGLWTKAMMNWLMPSFRTRSGWCLFTTCFTSVTEPRTSPASGC